MSHEPIDERDADPAEDVVDDFDELARRAGAALRRPAPEGGVRAIEARQRRRQTGRVVAVGGGAIVVIVLGVVGARSLRSSDDDPRPADTVPVPESTVPPGESVPVADPTGETVPAADPADAPSGPTLWTALEPGAIAPLPPAPIETSNDAALVWTGTELIVWGGTNDDDPCCSTSDEGAALDPATGAWRTIAAPPEGLTPGLTVWTGAEMAVWGRAGQPSAAYDPATDQWRRIADPPVSGALAFSVGAEVILVGDPDVSSAGFAYDPTSDSWRPLAVGPWSDLVCWCSGDQAPAWTGKTVVVARSDDDAPGTDVVVYDPATDEWRDAARLSDDVGLPVVVPGRDGGETTVALWSESPGVPVTLLDDGGNAIGELPVRPPDLVADCARPPGNGACLLTSLSATAVGGEILFWHSGTGWALDLDGRTWRSFVLDGREPKWDGTQIVAVGDLLFAWGAGRDGLVYRAAVG